ncbi:MAG TPA: glycosyltransferase family 87 protein [Candidatus Limnocylindrales bacterium]
MRRTAEAGGRVARLGLLALPFAALLTFAVVVGAIVASAARAGSLGFDFLAYYDAARRVLTGGQLYDVTVQQAGAFGIFYYPPPFLLAVLPFGLLDAGAATWLWTGLLLVAFGAGVAIMPVPRTVRWLVILLAGLSWPFAYAIKLGQVGPLLFLLFAAGWRWMDRPGPLGLAAAAGAAIKLQPGLVLVWAMGTGRVRAVLVGVVALAGATVAATALAGGPHIWPDYLALLRNVADPITTPHNFTPGAIAYQLGAPDAAAALVQTTVSVVVAIAVAVAARRATAEASYLVVVVASQLLSPVLWDHYAMLLLLPVAWLVARGHWWAVAIPLATSSALISVSPAATYPLAFACTIVALLGVGIRRVPQLAPRVEFAG